ncbi:MAG: AAA family ATPase [Alphaproteobacteria bacterium]|nr:AAA family ATPase [Alphaproteobacteria bacterium]MBN2675163.1 AAA family ATPase [Alphaproteobacteria bacterium]
MYRWFLHLVRQETLLDGATNTVPGKERRNGMQALGKIQVVDLESIKIAIATKMDSAAYSSWIAPLEFDLSDTTLSLITPNQFSTDFIKNVYLNILESVAADFNLSLHIGSGVTSQNIVQSANDNETKIFVPTAASAQTSIAFNNFITSEENSFVVSACRKLASGSASFSLLFMYGSTGCGKSLLTECINTEAVGRTLMMTGSQFVSEFSRSLREHSIFAFKDFCRNCDTFIMDDVHVLAGKRATTEEFLHLLTDLRGANKKVVLTSNSAPSNLSGFDRRLQSIFASGLVADVAAPNKNVRKTMLLRSGVALNVAETLSSRITGDGHLINGVAMKIKTYTELMNEKVTMDVAEKLLTDTLQKNKTPLSMVKTMCEKLGVSFDEICGKGRSRTLVRARQIMMVALKSVTKLSLSEIGRICGDRDHATVLYAISQIEKAKSSDLILATEINQMIEECR